MNENNTEKRRVEKYNSDLIIMMMYNPTSIGKIDWSTHFDTFDFR